MDPPSMHDYTLFPQYYAWHLPSESLQKMAMKNRGTTL